MTIIDDLYSRRIRKLSLPERLDLARRILNDAADEGEETIARERSLLELEGLGAEIWQGVDAQEYVDGLRQEWSAASSGSAPGANPLLASRT